MTLPIPRPSPPTSAADPPPAKRAKISSSLPFHSTLLEASNVARLASAFSKSEPYKHAVVNQLFEPGFLRQARKEIVEQISFREKETDIYRIAQTGDLTNLSGLPAAELALLPTLLALRDSIYSPTFRAFVQSVTGCGPLSGIKTDMSCNEYGEGCYLLNHDDVIGTRRISFILYLVLEEPEWKKEWGGALELYPVLPADPNNPDRPNVPAAKPSVSIPPAFNQFAFFTVQPGHSFHSVEEVVVEGDGEKGGVGARLSLSGWFHQPTETEEGYEGGEGYAAKSSLQQLYATTLEPAVAYTTPPTLPLPLLPSPSEITLLETLINPAYFTAQTLSQLRPQFVETSQLVLSSFLRADVATELESLIRAREAEDEQGRRGALIGGQRVNLVPPQSLGETAGWTLIGPPHIQRFCALSPSPSPTEDRLATLLRAINTLFASEAFRNFLAALTSLLPLAHTTHVRRFRPGLDYTLARGEPAAGEPRLDVGLALTPVPARKPDRETWEGGEAGGWELWLAGEEGGDEATYGAGAQTGGEDDEPLLALEPGWNRLQVVLRDPGVLRFVKYVSARAPGSRWDVGGEWEIGAVEVGSEDGAAEEEGHE